MTVEFEHKGNSRPAAFCVCKGLGMECSFEVTGATDNEVMRNFIEHAGSAHNIDLLTADVIYRVPANDKKVKRFLNIPGILRSISHPHLS